MEHRQLQQGTAGRRSPGAPARDAPAGPAAQMLAIQSIAGNRAVTGLLQRQVVDEEVGEFIELDPLDDAQVASAIRFYRNQPGRYTPDIMRQIQAAVGVAETGEADEATVQAVALWQESEGSSDPPLKVDGKAGPRTLPRLFAHGLNAAGEGQAFGEEAQTGVIDRWGDLTPAERAAELVRLVNTHLQAAGVPPVVPNATSTGNNAGQFDFATWQMDIGLPALSPDSVDRDAAADLVDTIYHEARHAEQWFRMAQLRAGQGRSARAIATEMGIPRNIADLAKADPLDPQSMQGLIAQGWFDSVYGVHSAHRERTLGALDPAHDAVDKAQARFDKNPTPANQARLDAALERLSRAHDAYRNLPEENDAWATGPMTSAGVTRGSPVADPAPEPEGGTPPAGTPGPAGGPVPTPMKSDQLAEALQELLRGRRAGTR